MNVVYLCAFYSLRTLEKMTDLVHLFILSHITYTGIYYIEVYNMAYHDKGDFYLSRFFCLRPCIISSLKYCT